ncbi:hypothetical protein A2U01_0113785, partial [Trifolium medium]|nr:hypothetical protein [Trifolium medium]
MYSVSAHPPRLEPPIASWALSLTRGRWSSFQGSLSERRSRSDFVDE